MRHSGFWNGWRPNLVSAMFPPLSWRGHNGARRGGRPVKDWDAETIPIRPLCGRGNLWRNCLRDRQLKQAAYPEFRTGDEWQGMRSDQVKARDQSFSSKSSNNENWLKPQRSELWIRRKHFKSWKRNEITNSFLGFAPWCGSNFALHNSRIPHLCWAI